MEYTVLEKPSCQVFKIPPRGTAGHKAELWTNNIWTGKLKVVIRTTDEKEEVTIKFINAEGKLFGEAPLETGNLRSAFEPVSDSSRYFVVKLQDKAKAKHAYVGLGFNDRSDAFDVNYVLTQYTTPTPEVTVGSDTSIRATSSTLEPEPEPLPDFSTDDLAAFADIPLPPQSSTRFRV